MVLYDPQCFRQGKSNRRCRVQGVTSLKYFHEMDPEASKKMTPDTQDESEFLPENGEPEEEGGCTGVGDW